MGCGGTTFRQHVVEKLNNPEAMATVNYSVPEDVKKAFNERFKGRNMSAIIADLMQRAVAEEQAKYRRKQAMKDLVDRRSARTPVSEDDVQDARDEVRRWR